MPSRLFKRALLGAVIVATAALGGCIVAPYPYHRYAYYGAPGPVVAPGYYRPYYRY